MLRSEATVTQRKSKFDKEIIIPALYGVRFTAWGPSKCKAVVDMSRTQKRGKGQRWRLGIHALIGSWSHRINKTAQGGYGGLEDSQRKEPEECFQDSQRRRNQRRKARRAYSLRTEGRKNLKKGLLIRIKNYRGISWSVYCVLQVDILRRWSCQSVSEECQRCRLKSWVWLMWKIIPSPAKDTGMCLGFKNKYQKLLSEGLYFWRRKRALELFPLTRRSLQGLSKPFSRMHIEKD